MSLYNILHNKNPHTKEILELLKLSESDIERFRDCGVNKNENFIWILARTGGGNRKDFPNKNLTDNYYYRRNHDEKTDYTYAIYYFDISKGAELSLFRHDVFLML